MVSKLILVSFAILNCLLLQANAANYRYLMFVAGAGPTSSAVKSSVENLLKSKTPEGFTFSNVETVKKMGKKWSAVEALFSFENQTMVLTDLAMHKSMKKLFPSNYLETLSSATQTSLKIAVPVSREYAATVNVYKDARTPLPYNLKFERIGPLKEEIELLIYSKLDAPQYIPRGGITFLSVNKMYNHEHFYNSNKKHIMTFKLALYSIGDEPLTKEQIAKNIDAFNFLQFKIVGIKLAEWKYLGPFDKPDPFCRHYYQVDFTLSKAQNVLFSANEMMIVLNKATKVDANMYAAQVISADRHKNGTISSKLRVVCRMEAREGFSFMKYWNQFKAEVTEGTPINPDITVTKLSE